MWWIIIALISYSFWGLVNIGDKYFISHKINNIFVYFTVLTWCGAIGILMIPLIDFFVPSIYWLSIMFFATALYICGSLFYFRAVQSEDISRVNILWNLIPVFTLIIAWFTIGEKLNYHQFLAFIILVFGAVLASIHFHQKGIQFSKALLLMIISTICYAFYAVIIRYASAQIPFLTIYVWGLIAVVIFSFFFFLAPKFRRSFRLEMKLLNKKIFLFLLLVAILDELGILFNIWALSLGPAALIFALEGFQTLFVFSLTILISINKPYILKEELDKRNLALKVLALAVIVWGVFLINIG